jgi:hypothetical protein
METIDFFALLQKHNEREDGFMLSQVCQLVVTPKDLLYEFFYDDADKFAVLCVIKNYNDLAALERTTYKFADKDITIQQALEQLGFTSSQLTFTGIFTTSEIHPSVYMTTPIEKLGLAQGDLVLNRATT